MSSPQGTTYGRDHVDSTQAARAVAIALVGAAIVALGLDNRHDVELGYVFGSGSAPAWIVVAASAVGGVVIGWLIKHRPRNRL